MPRSLTFFLLLVSFGILFVGCAAPEPDRSMEDFTFSETDLQTVNEMAATSSSASRGVTELSVVNTGATVLTETVLVTSNPGQQQWYDNLRMTAVDQEGDNLYRVNNPFLNVRAAMNVRAALVRRLERGTMFTVTGTPTAEWAKVKLRSGETGYVAFRYIAKVTTEKRLPEDKKQFEGMYFVDFPFLNIRKDPSTQAEKMGELPGQAIVKPLSMNGEWARVASSGKEGYVSMQYLKPFQPVFLVRQDEYSAPILQYQADDRASIEAFGQHMAALKSAGRKILTLKTLYDTVLSQETRDTRISPDTVLLTITGVTAKNVQRVSDALDASGVAGTLFIRTRDIGLSGITEKTVLNLLANGNDLQSGGHTGDDLRSMTDSQVTLELGQSKKLLLDLTKKEVYAVAYPTGGVNGRVMQQAAQIPYLFGLTQTPDKTFTRTQFLRLPSLFVSGSMTASDIVKLVQPPM